MRILCAINPPSAIKKILDCLGLPSRPPPIFSAVPGDPLLGHIGVGPRYLHMASGHKPILGALNQTYIHFFCPFFSSKETGELSLSTVIVSGQ
jgi:hypothetical protein